MRLLTAADGRMKEMLEVSLKMNRRAGFEPRVLDINGTLGLGTPFVAPAEYADPRYGASHERFFGKLPYKPHMVSQELFDGDETVLWLDADAFAVRHFEEPEGDWDVAVTLRRRGESQAAVKWPLHYAYLNTGVMFFRPTRATHDFLSDWCRELPKTESHSDQEAMNRLLLRHDRLETHGQTFGCRGARVKVLRTDEWNWYYWPEPVPELAKIVHLKTNKRKAGLEWLKHV